MAQKSELIQVDRTRFSSRVLAEPQRESDKPHDECGIIGIYAPGADIAGLTARGIIYETGRGEEGWGLALNRGRSGTFYQTGEGKLRDSVDFEEYFVVAPRISVPQLREYGSDHFTTGVGQARYSTSGRKDAWQPFFDEKTRIATVHNGNLTNARRLLELVQDKKKNDPPSDTWALHQLVVEAPGENLEQRLLHVLPMVDPAASLIFSNPDQVFGYRDYLGMKPLELAEFIDGSGYLLASEDSAVRRLGARKIRDIKPGEGVVIDKDGPRTFFRDSRSEEVRKALCFFEMVYTMRPDSFFQGQPVSEIRYRLGAIGAQKHLERGIIPTLVVPVQESGVLYAQGYINEMSRHSDVKVLDIKTGIIKDSYSGRVFITKSGTDRGVATTNKHTANAFDLDNESVAIIEDSIVRGDASTGTVRDARSGYLAYRDVPIAPKSFLGEPSEGEVVYRAPRFGYANQVPSLTHWTEDQASRVVGPPQSVHFLSVAPMILNPCYWGMAFGDKGELAPTRFAPNANVKPEVAELVRQAIGADTLVYLEDHDILTGIWPDGYNFDPNDPDGPMRQNGFCARCIGEDPPTPIDGVLGLVR